MSKIWLHRTTPEEQYRAGKTLVWVFGSIMAFSVIMGIICAITGDYGAAILITILSLSFGSLAVFTGKGIIADSKRRKEYEESLRNKQKSLLIERKVYNRKPDLNYICPKCGGKLVLRKSKYGDFYGCSNYFSQGCRFTRKV